MAEEIRKAWYDNENTSGVYVDGKRVGEVKRESGWFGGADTIVRTDSSGKKVSETKSNDTFSGSVDVTRDTSGRVISETRPDVRFGGRRYDVTRDTSGRVISEAHVEDRFGKKVRVVEHARGSSSGGGHSEPESDYAGSGGYSPTPSTQSQKGNDADIAFLKLAIPLLLAAGLVFVGYRPIQESLKPKYFNLIQQATKSNYIYGTPLDEGCLTNISFIQAKDDVVPIEQNKSYRAYTGMTFNYPLQTQERGINVVISIPDDYITQFKINGLQFFSNKRIVKDGPLAKKIDISGDGAMQSEEIALFYDFTRRSLEKKLEHDGHFAMVNYWQRKTAAELEKELNESMQDWAKKDYLPGFVGDVGTNTNYIYPLSE